MELPLDSTHPQTQPSNDALVTTKEADRYGILGTDTWTAVTVLEQGHKLDSSKIRILSIDGDEQPHTMDFVPGRISMNIANDEVTSYEIEGDMS